MTEPGFYRGRHFTEWVDTVKEQKRAGCLEEVIGLLLGLIDATEAESPATGCGVAPWYYEQLAIIYRKQKAPASEVAILERYESMKKAPGVSPAKLAARLQIARKRLADDLRP